MRALTATEFLSVWERGASQPPVQQALTLLAAACPESSQEELASLPIGRRDARLLTLREWMFGPQVIGLADCPACGGQMEMTFSVADLQGKSSPDSTGELAMQLEKFDVRFRLPNSADLLAICGGDAAANRDRLLDRCLLTRRDDLPAHALDAVIEKMSEADPLADVRLALSCSACGHAWEAAFDIVSFFWREIGAWARGFLREVHTLAAAYGWRESDILAMSPARRQVYLEMVTA